MTLRWLLLPITVSVTLAALFAFSLLHLYSGPWSIGIIRDWDPSTLTVDVVGTFKVSAGHMVWQPCGVQVLRLPYDPLRFTPSQGLVVEYYSRSTLFGDHMDYQIARIHGPQNPSERC